ncbi:hypothetical protein LHK12_16815 [Providencia rettgeri]|nr:hypothetical protein [Providencia rettgeri]
MEPTNAVNEDPLFGSYRYPRPALGSCYRCSGIGLQLSNAARSPINLGEYSTPQLVSPGQNQLTYYVTPVRTSAQLNAGAYQALIRFQVSYE